MLYVNTTLLTIVSFYKAISIKTNEYCPVVFIRQGTIKELSNFSLNLLLYYSHESRKIVCYPKKCVYIKGKQL